MTVYNAKETGYAVPFRDKLDAEGKSTAPSLVPGSGTIPSTSMNYTVDAADRNQLQKTIYVNEAENIGGEVPDVFYLILEGYYTEEGQPENTDTPTYYRVDFYAKDAEVPAGDRIDILRNYSYNVIITDIGGPGYEDEENAKNSIPLNLEYSIVDWSDGEMKYVVFQGPHYLAVSECTIDLSKSAQASSFLVKTNYPSGWNAKVTEGDSWMGNLTPDSSPNIDLAESLSFTVSQNDGADRTGKIGISAGTHLTLDVVINQSAEEPMEIRLWEIVETEEAGQTKKVYVDAGEEWVFASGMPNTGLVSRNLAVTWTPADKDIIMYIESDPSFGWLSGDPKAEFDSKASGGEVTQWIAPMNYDRIQGAPLPYPTSTAEEVFPSFTATLRYWLPTDQNVNNALKITQVHNDVYADVFPYEQFVMDGSEYSFRVRSNTSWEALISADAEKYMEIITETGGFHPDEEGELFRFRTREDHQNIGMVTVSVTFIADDPPHAESARRMYSFQLVSPPQEDKFIEGGLANCYMLQPGGNAIKIPVAQANRGGGNHIASGRALDYKFIWTDHPGGLSDAGVVSKVEIDGTGPDAQLIVYPGTGAGNAVVAVTDKSSGEIYWSWHLWVTDFDPNGDANDRYQFRNYEFLDRNIGALTDTPGDPGAMGLYYQWGRKDPFPSASGVNVNSFVKTYDWDGKEVTFGTISKDQGSSKTNLLNSIQNPFMFIKTGSENWYGGWTEVQNEMLEFWSEGRQLADVEKGVYDPCPDGWKVVPGSSTDQNVQWYNLASAGSVYEPQYRAHTVTNGDFFLGYWPHVGYIDPSGELKNVGSQGRYWMANIVTGGTDGMNFEFSPSANGQGGQGKAAAHGQSVRCMRKVSE